MRCKGSKSAGASHIRMENAIYSSTVAAERAKMRSVYRCAFAAKVCLFCRLQIHCAQKCDTFANYDGLATDLSASLALTALVTSALQESLSDNPDVTLVHALIWNVERPRIYQPTVTCLHLYTSTPDCPTSAPNPPIPESPAARVQRTFVPIL